MGVWSKTAIYEYAQRVEKLKGKDGEVFRLVLDNKTIKDLIVFMNTQDQLGRRHIDSEGEALFNKLTDRTTYSLFDKKGRGGKPYQLKDTGEFWRSFKATIGNGFIEITSDPLKDGTDLFDVFGEDIEGLTEQNLENLIKTAHAFYVRWFIQNMLPS